MRRDIGADLKSATGRLGESTTLDGDLSTQPVTASFMDPALDTHTQNSKEFRQESLREAGLLWRPRRGHP